MPKPTSQRRAEPPAPPTKTNATVTGSCILFFGGIAFFVCLRRVVLPATSCTGSAGLMLERKMAVFEPAQEGGYTCFVAEIPAAISQGETLEEAKANLLDALKLVLECQRELAEKELSPEALRETIEFAGT